MSVPWQAITGLVWAIAAPPLLVYAATRVRAGQHQRHAIVMSLAATMEIAVLLAFTLFMVPGPRRNELATLQIFKIHLAFALATLAGLAWQIGSRAIPALRPLHRHSGPYVVLVWCLALVTGIYNYVFLYLMR